ncbi:TPA: helix-turn-helix domain-containing protein [Streptococcus suis]
MEIDNVAVGSRIKSIRLDKGATMEEFGKAFNTSKGTVNNWEKGRNLPNKENLLKIAKIGNISVEQLLYGSSGKSYYNWDRVKEMLRTISNNTPLDELAMENTKKVVDLAYFLNLGIFEINDIYLFQKNNQSPLQTLEDLQDYFETVSDGLLTYSENIDDLEAQMDIEIQSSFLNSYAYQIKRYLKDGIWASDTLSNLREKKLEE